MMPTLEVSGGAMVEVSSRRRSDVCSYANLVHNVLPNNSGVARGRTTRFLSSAQNSTSRDVQET